MLSSPFRLRYNKLIVTVCRILCCSVVSIPWSYFFDFRDAQHLDSAMANDPLLHRYRECICSSLSKTSLCTLKLTSLGISERFCLL